MSLTPRTDDPATQALRAGARIALGLCGDRVGRDTPVSELIKTFVRRQLRHIRKFRSRE